MKRFKERKVCQPEPPTLISQFTIALVSCVLLGMTFGYVMPEAIRWPTGVAGSIGLCFYAYRRRFVEAEYASKLRNLQEVIDTRLRDLTSLCDLLSTNHPDWVVPDVSSGSGPAGSSESSPPRD
jgi:hypothetical protein